MMLTSGHWGPGLKPLPEHFVHCHLNLLKANVVSKGWIWLISQSQVIPTLKHPKALFFSQIWTIIYNLSTLYKLRS